MKKLFIMVSLVFSIFLVSDEVFAYTVPSDLGTVGNYFNWREDINNRTVAEVTSYDIKLALFDEFGNDLPVCTTDLYITEDNNGNHGINRYSGITKLCNSGTSPSLDKIKQYFNYYFRINYKNHWTDEEYHIFLIFGTFPTISTDSWGHVTFNNTPDILISTFPTNYELYNSCDFGDLFGNCTVINGNDYRTANNRRLNYYSAEGDIYYGTYWPNFYFYLSDLNNEYNDYLDVESISTNFEFTGYSGNNVTFNYVDSFEFGTDTEITLSKDNYLRLIPKKQVGFDTYLWTDSNFGFREDYNISDYERVSGGALNEIDYVSLNDFKWFRWDYSFSLEDLSKNKSLAIYNYGNDILHVKFKSEDFYYYVLDRESSDIVLNGVTYKNNWEDLHNTFSSFTPNNRYSVDEYSSASDFIRDLPTYVSSFSRCFVFIGTMISSVFVIFTGELLYYFYILFGLMLIMLIIMILK